MKTIKELHTIASELMNSACNVRIVVNYGKLIANVDAV